jgi:hypothetical protein
MLHTPQFLNNGTSGGSEGCAPIQGVTATILNGSGSSLHYVPFSGYYNYSIGFWLLTQSELGNAKQFTGLQLDKSFNDSANTMLKQTVRMYHTTASSIPSQLNYSSPSNFEDTTLVGQNSNFVVSDETIVYDNSSWFFTGSKGWKTMNFDNNFCYNGTDNVVIMWVNNDGAYISSSWPYWDTDSTNSSSNMGAYEFLDANPPSSPVNNFDQRPHTKLIY